MLLRERFLLCTHGFLGCCVFPQHPAVILCDLAHILCPVKKLRNALGPHNGIHKAGLAILVHIFDAQLHSIVLVGLHSFCLLKPYPGLGDLLLLLADLPLQLGELRCQGGQVCIQPLYIGSRIRL